MFMHSRAATLDDLSIAGRTTVPLNARMPARKTRPAGPITPAEQANSLPPAAQPTVNGMVLQRERLHALIDARLPGAVWLHGPTGAGKTVLLRSWLQRAHAPSIWLTVDERLRDPAALFAAITAVAGAHGAGSLPAFSPEHRDEPAAFARGYFARLAQALPDALAFVVDDVHHLVGSTAPLLAIAIDCFGGRRNLCFASQLLPDAAFAPQLAGSRLWIVGHRLLAFDVDEARALATRFGTPEPMLDALVSATDGWAAGLMLAMQLGSSGGTGDGSGDPLESVRTPLALLIAGQVIGGASGDDLRRLRLMAELPQIPIELGDVDPAWASACARLQGLAERGLFVERLSADRRTPDVVGSKVRRLSKGCWRLHDLFRHALREPGTLGDPDQALGARLVDQLLEIDRLDLAWQLAARLGADRLAVVIAGHGAAALRDVHLLTLVQMATPLADRAAPTIAIWLARGLIGNDHVAALRACEEAFAGFAAAGDTDGAALSIALALFIVFATIENAAAITVWVERFSKVSRSSIESAAAGEQIAIRVAGEVVHDLLIGGRASEELSGNVLQDRLMIHVSAEALSANETILAGSLLVAAMRRAIRGAEVDIAILRVEGLASYARSAPHIRASWNIENGFHFTRAGAPVRARGCFNDALAVADENALLQPRIGSLIGLVRLELALGDIRRAQELISTLEGLGQDRLGRQCGWVLHLRARVELLSGHPDAALVRIEQAEQLILEAGFARSMLAILEVDRLQMLYAKGLVDESFALARRIIEGSATGDALRFSCMLGLLEAHASWDSKRDHAVELLASNLPTARSLDPMAYLPLLPEVASQTAARGMRHGIEVDFLKQVIALRGLLAPADAPENWPWAVRVEVLRPFRIVLAGEPLSFAGKVQQKPLELLKYLVCNRDLVADSSAIATALWPDAEDNAARKSLEVTVSRLRKLLNDDALVIVREGKVSLDGRRISSDAKEFIEATLEAETVVTRRHDPTKVAELGDRLLALFHELPLEHEESSAWREGTRERYRTAFVRAARALIAYWTQTGDPARAQRLIEAALGREPLAENLYRTLIQLHVDAGNHTEAMRVYRQCRQMLSVLIGAQPSSETERLKNLIKL